MTNDYGKPCGMFLIEVREKSAANWNRHLLCATLEKAVVGAAHLNAIDERHIYRVQGHPETEPNPSRPRTITMRAWDYPKDTVVVACDRCERRGRYPKARFIEIVGSGTTLADALKVLAKDCPMKGETGIAKSERCGAYFPEL